MSALAKIKKAAAQHEQDRHYDKALAEYARLLDGGADADDEVDVTLFNRAGDLALRAGDVPRAVTYFERAIDLYAAGGFLNNAVALAVKVLRHAPGHLAAHHTLGLLYGRKGFRAEARQHLADYAAQMHRAGRTDEVRRTLAELAALGATPDDVAAVRELLTARAATSDDAGALVREFADALAGADVRPSAESTPRATSIPLSELIEFEIRGPRLAPVADPASTAVRWLTALPGDPAALRVSALRTLAPAVRSDIVSTAVTLDADFEQVAPFDAEPLDLGDFEIPAAAAPGIEPMLDFTVAPLDVSGFDVFDVPVAQPAIEVDAASLDESRAEQPEPAGAADLVFLDEPLPPVAAVSPPPVPVAVDEPTDLGEWLRSTALPASTRLVTGTPRESGDEDADFGAALQAFTSGIAQSVDAGDRESHYDLGVAFREMGLLTEAVREFQRALAAPGSGLREREALAQCFLDMQRPELALAALEQAAADAVASGAAAETLVGVHYVLAEAARAVGRVDGARAWYVRVLATDYGFRDAATHLAALPPPTRASGQ
ncbi:MAG TPA: hypothetical protein VGD56_03405 [Gemmatirosa sp.]